ncbi:MAG: fatty acid desaturase [Bdellovibrionales bacterium]|nr:fatty acid desaturase [Bdellovibrionales bacterium]
MSLENSTFDTSAAISSPTRSLIVKSDWAAAKRLILPIAFGVFCFLNLSSGWILYSLGQILGAVFFAQCFILLHEFGHDSFFKTRYLNTVFGQIASFLVFLPFHNWKKIHALHHKWTGWRDLDPTTEKTFDGRFGTIQRQVIHFCWKYHVPIFTLGYRLGIYWKLEKLKRHLSPRDYFACQLNMAAMVIVYIGLIFFAGDTLLRILPALYFSWAICDVVSLSQHSHIEMPVSNGIAVQPLKYREQAQYSRSLILPSAIGEYFYFNMNFHEAHHHYPGLPCYHLPKVQVPSKNAYPFWPWLKKVKSMPGVVFIFTTSKDRDF